MGGGGGEIVDITLSLGTLLLTVQTIAVNVMFPRCLAYSGLLKHFRYQWRECPEKNRKTESTQKQAFYIQTEIKISESKFPSHCSLGTSFKNAQKEGF